MYLVGFQERLPERGIIVSEGDDLPVRGGRVKRTLVPAASVQRCLDQGASSVLHPDAGDWQATENGGRHLTAMLPRHESFDTHRPVPALGSRKAIFQAAD
ncbi:hypothetical protein BOSEA1005_12254 [Hyphomicrobiales bacterium]|nr:hypothetical protein BOSEA1005_12254 [Hyphomicrobiales bacterium]CAI0342987.1 hypothetical protein BO1005MUT1_210052 [Hyphomicrobiales bacterium]